jgi:pyruvate/2-oxoglutarate dehydrogenase complex dihydrolipoamide acyltransferase (E2) component
LFLAAVPSQASVMSIPLLVPDLGAEAETVRISSWYALAGERVELDEPVVELLIGGATCDLTAPCQGWVRGPLKPVDSAVTLGETLAWIEPAH